MHISHARAQELPVVFLSKLRCALTRTLKSGEGRIKVNAMTTLATIIASRARQHHAILPTTRCCTTIRWNIPDYYFPHLKVTHPNYQHRAIVNGDSNRRHQHTKIFQTLIRSKNVLDRWKHLKGQRAKTKGFSCSNSVRSDEDSKRIIISYITDIEVRFPACNPRSNACSIFADKIFFLSFLFTLLG